MVKTLNLPLHGFYQSDTRPIADKACVNLYPHFPEVEGLSQSQLYATEGIELVATTHESEVNRGGIVMDGVPYFVNGTYLYRVNRTFDDFGDPIYATENLGIIAGDEVLSLATNGSQICIVRPNSATAYIYSDITGLVTITDPAFIPSPIATVVNSVVFTDGYFVFSADNSVFFHSNLNDGLSYTATDFGTYDDSRRDIVGLHVHREQLYVFGATTSKAYSNIGGTGFVFQEVSGFSLPKGLSARNSLIELDGTFAFIGRGVNESPRVYQFTGNGYAPISTSAIDYILEKYNDVDLNNSFSFNYSKQGAIFGGWSLTNNTIVFDSKASQISGALQWHERRSKDLNQKQRWRVNTLLQVYGELFVADSEGGNIGLLKSDVATEYGVNVEREFSLQTIEANSKPLIYADLEVILDNGKEDDGLITLSYTNNGYQYTQSRSREVGNKGDYGQKVKFYRLGRSNKFRIFKFTMTSPIKWKILKVLVSVL